MDINIKITEAFPEQHGVNVNFSTAAWMEGRTVFVVVPVDANGAALSGDALMDYLATVAPVSELEVLDAIQGSANSAEIEALVGLQATRGVQTQTDRKVAAVLAESAIKAL